MNASPTVWVLETLNAESPTYRRLLADLEPAERERAARFRFEHDRHDYVCAHGLLHRVLDRVVGRPRTLFVDDGGKPRLRDSRLDFNLTHTRGFAAVAVCDAGEIGVDAEWLRSAADLLAVAERFFAPEEIRWLHAHPEASRDVAFYRLWTLKEAYLKARGAGLTIDLGAFRFELDDAITLTAPETIDPKPDRWSFRQWRPSPSHLAAVAWSTSATVRIEDGRRLVEQ